MAIERVTLPIYSSADTVGRGSSASVAERVLTGVQGVRRVYVNAEMEMVYVEYDPALTEPLQLSELLDEAGIGLLEAQSDTSGEALGGESKSVLHPDLRRLVIATFLSGALLYALCVLVSVALPSTDPMSNLWQHVLWAFNPSYWRTGIFGALDVLMYGALVAGLVVVIYNVLPEQLFPT